MKTPPRAKPSSASHHQDNKARSSILGLTTAEAPYTPLTKLKNIACRFSLMICAKIVKLLQMMPAAPGPATALPTMNAFELFAAAHTIDPISKISSDAMKTLFMLKSVYSLAKVGCVDACVRR